MWLARGAWSTATHKPSAWYLAQKAVVLLHPEPRCGEVIWALSARHTSLSQACRPRQGSAQITQPGRRTDCETDHRAAVSIGGYVRSRPGSVITFGSNSGRHLIICRRWRAGSFRRLSAGDLPTSAGRQVSPHSPLHARLLVITRNPGKTALLITRKPQAVGVSLLTVPQTLDARPRVQVRRSIRCIVRESILTKLFRLRTFRTAFTQSFAALAAGRPQSSHVGS